MYGDSFDYKLEDLGFSEEQIKIIRKIISMKNGMILISGVWTKIYISRYSNINSYKHSKMNDFCILFIII